MKILTINWNYNQLWDPYHHINCFPSFFSQGLICPPSYNPAEFFIQNLSVVPGEEEASLQKIKQLCDVYETVDREINLQPSMPHIQAARNSITRVIVSYIFIKVRLESSKPHPREALLSPLKLWSFNFQLFHHILHSFCSLFFAYLIIL